MSENMTSQKVCIVDDDETNLCLTTMMLEDEYEVVQARSGEEAIEISLREQPDLILLDIMLPESSGYDVCEKLQEYEETKSIPVVFLTGLEDDDSQAIGLDIGAADYLTKPVNSQVMKARIRKILQTDMYIEYLEQSLKSKDEKLSTLKKAV